MANLSLNLYNNLPINLYIHTSGRLQIEAYMAIAYMPYDLCKAIYPIENKEQKEMKGI